MSAFVLVQAWLWGMNAVAAAPAPVRHEYTQVQMGVPWKIVVYATEEKAANTAVEAAFRRVEELNGVLSDYDPNSELNRLSKSAPTPEPVRLSPDLWTVLSHSQELARKTDGVFDVTVGPLTQLWRRSRRNRELPEPDRLAQALQSVGYKAVELDRGSRTAQLTKPKMRLDLGGIAMGYAADEALEVLRQHGIESAMVDASGDIVLGDPPPGEDGWTIGVAPLDPDADPSHYLTLSNVAITTSGDAFQHVEINGHRYSHIVDPKTGLGLKTSSAATVIAPTGMMADSLATAVSVLGPKRGLELIECTPDAAAIVVTAEAEGVRSNASKRFQSLGSKDE